MRIRLALEREMRRIGHTKRERARVFDQFSGAFVGLFRQTRARFDPRFIPRFFETGETWLDAELAPHCIIGPLQIFQISRDAPFELRERGIRAGASRAEAMRTQSMPVRVREERTQR